MRYNNLNKIQSLIERIEKKDKPLLGESLSWGFLAEAAGKRRQVSRDEFIDIMNKSADSNKDSGKFASITYVKSAKSDVYKTKKAWDQEGMEKALGDASDRSEDEWYKNLRSFQDGEIKKNPVTQIVVAQRYVFHWTTPQQFDAQQRKYYDKESDLRAQFNLPQKFRDPTVAHVKSDYSPMFTHNETVNTDGSNGNMSFNFNMANCSCKTMAYLVDENGKIVADIPEGVFKAMRIKKKRGAPETDAVEILKDNPELLKEYTKKKEELAAEFRHQNFKSNQVLCMAANVNGESIFTINPNIMAPIEKGSNVNVDPSEWIPKAEELLGETFEDIDNFAKNNHGSVTPSSNESRLRGVVRESVMRAIHEAMEPGEISHGTMRNEDVLPKLMSVLFKEDPARARKIWKDNPEFLEALCDKQVGKDNPWWESEDANYIAEELFDVMNDYAPEGHYFGSHIGDGSSYGYWPSDDLD